MKQMLTTNSRLDKLVAAQIDFISHSMLEGNVLDDILHQLSELHPIHHILNFLTLDPQGIIPSSNNEPPNSPDPPGPPQVPPAMATIGSLDDDDDNDGVDNSQIIKSCVKLSKAPCKLLYHIHLLY